MSSKLNKNSSKKSKDNTNVFSSRTMVFVCIVLAFLFYGNSIGNGYSMDDELVTTTDRQPHVLSELGIKGIKKIFTTHSFLDGKQNYEYRPVTIFSFAIEWSLFGPDSKSALLENGKPNIGKRAQISHFINVFLYAIVGILLFQLLQVLFQHKQSTLSAAVVILFMIHPIHSEVVNNIKNRDEILSLLFALLSAIQAFHWVDSKKWSSLFLMFGCIVLSLLSKKSNLPFIVMIPMMLYFFRNLSLKNIAWIFLALLLTKLVFNYAKNGILNLDDEAIRIHSFHENPLYELGFWERIPMYFYSNFFYVSKLCFPYPLSFFYGYNAVPLVGYYDWQFYVGLCMILLFLFIAIRGLKNKSIFSFSILYFLLAVGGVANLLGPIAGIFAERLVFSASIGFCIGLVFLYHKFRPESFSNNFSIGKSFYLPLAILLIPSLFYSIQRNKVWNSKLSLYSNDVQHQSNSAKVNSLLASEYQLDAMEMQKSSNYDFNVMMSKVDSAIFYYNQSIDIFHRYESNLNNRGVLYYMFKYDYAEALENFKKAISVNQEYTEGIINKGNAYSKIAESFHVLHQAVPIPSKRTQLNLNSKDYRFSGELIQALSLTKQFEYNLIEISKNQKLRNKHLILQSNIQNLESLSNLLSAAGFRKKLFVHLSNENINYQLIFNALKGIRLDLFLNENPKIAQQGNEAVFGITKFLKKNYIDSARSAYKDLKDLEPHNKSIYNVEEQFAVLLMDYTWLIALEEEFIDQFPDEHHGPNYVQIGNGYRSLNKKEKALTNFKKALAAFEEEKKSLQNGNKENRARLNLVTRELVKLPDFIEKLEMEINRENE